MLKQSKTSKIRKTMLWVSLFLFPLTLNYFSPALSMAGAFQGLVSGSILTFAGLFITGMFFRRAWCGWLCPGGAIGELCRQVNNRPVAANRLKWIRYGIFTVWLGLIVMGFFRAGGIKQIAPFFMTEHFVAVDSPEKFIIYYIVVSILFVLDLALGRRGACHSICWMSPFLTAGAKLGQLLHLPQLVIHANRSDCIACGKCTKTCQMSIDVLAQVSSGKIDHSDCVLCGECADACPKQVLTYQFK
jgi:polyferredoxin